MAVMEMSNRQIAKILRDVAAAYTIKKTGNIFQIRAYENAADSIEHSTAQMQDLWQENKLDGVPALGEKIRTYLEELFTHGKVKHFEEAKKDIPPVVFELLDVPGIGPKTAIEIANLKIKGIDDLKRQIKSGELVQKGFSAKISQKIMGGINQLNSMGGRMLMHYACAQADKILKYLRSCPSVEQADVLGSLRRRVATVGDLDFSVSSKNPKGVVDFFCKMPGVTRVLDRGDSKATVLLKNGLQIDLLVGKPQSYGALLQYFTGSKNHNIHLRKLAQDRRLSLSEYGVKNTRTNKTIPTKTEDEFYKLLGMQVPSPEIREDTGEIEASLHDGLPKLVELKDIEGDLHLHSNFPLEKPSHAPGIDSIEAIVKYAQSLGYSYVGISDHSPSHLLPGQQLVSTVEKRTKFIQSLNKNTKSIRVLNGLEIDILSNGSLSIPDEILRTLDYCIAGIHSGHLDPKEVITKRLIRALSNPFVDIISHPSGRLLNERDSSDVDWDVVFKVAAKNKKLLEINSHPIRLDLRDDLVRRALSFGVKLIVNTDAHQISQMDNMSFGVSVARRGWATKKDIVNTWSWTNFAKWFKISSP